MIKVKDGRNQIKRLFQLRARIKKLQEIENGLAEDAITHLKTHGTLKQDEWAALISITKTCRPKWKEEFIKECGESKAVSILESTEPSVCEKVEIYKDGIKVTY